MFMPRSANSTFSAFPAETGRWYGRSRQGSPACRHRAGVGKADVARPLRGKPGRPRKAGRVGPDSPGMNAGLGVAQGNQVGKAAENLDLAAIE
ncbi:MAG: hypothetical protein ACRDPE_08230 [Solirubrobacterales bacterium]